MKLITFLFLVCQLGLNAQFTLRSDLKDTYVPDEELSFFLENYQDKYLAETVNDQLYIHNLSNGDLEDYVLIDPRLEFFWYNNELILHDYDSLWIRDPNTAEVLYSTKIRHPEMTSDFINVTAWSDLGILGVLGSDSDGNVIVDHFDIEKRTFVDYGSRLNSITTRRLNGDLFFLSNDSIFKASGPAQYHFILDSVSSLVAVGPRFVVERNGKAFFMSSDEQFETISYPSTNVFYSARGTDHYYILTDIYDAQDYSVVLRYQQDFELIEEIELTFDAKSILSVTDNEMVILGWLNGSTYLIRYSISDGIIDQLSISGSYGLLMEQSKKFVINTSYRNTFYDLETFEGFDLVGLPAHSHAYIIDSQLFWLSKLDGKRQIYKYNIAKEEAELLSEKGYNLGTYYNWLSQRDGMFGKTSEGLYWDPKQEFFVEFDPSQDSAYYDEWYLLHDKAVWLEQQEDEGFAFHVRDLETGHLDEYGNINRWADLEHSGQVVFSNRDFVYDAVNDVFYPDYTDGLVQSLSQPLFEFDDVRYSYLDGKVYSSAIDDPTRATLQIETGYVSTSHKQLGERALLYHSKDGLYYFDNDKYLAIDENIVDKSYKIYQAKTQDHALLFARFAPPLHVDLTTQRLDSLPGTVSRHFLGSDDTHFVLLDDGVWNILDSENYTYEVLDFLLDSDIVMTGDAEQVVVYNLKEYQTKFYSISGELVKSVNWESNASAYAIRRERVHGNYLVWSNSNIKEYYVLDLNTGEIIAQIQDKKVGASSYVTKSYDGKAFFRINKDRKGYQIYSIDLKPLMVNVTEINTPATQAIIVPNPARMGQSIQFASDDIILDSPMKLKLLNMGGQIVHTGQLVGGTYKLPQGIKSGMYAVVLYDDEKKYTSKLLIIP